MGSHRQAVLWGTRGTGGGEGPSCQRWREDWLERIPLHHVKFPAVFFIIFGIHNSYKEI